LQPSAVPALRRSSSSPFNSFPVAARGPQVFPLEEDATFNSFPVAAELFVSGTAVPSVFQFFPSCSSQGSPAATA
jgi:hypothetical protein